MQLLFDSLTLSFSCFLSIFENHTECNTTICVVLWSFSLVVTESPKHQLHEKEEGREQLAVQSVCAGRAERVKKGRSSSGSPGRVRASEGGR